MNDLVPRSIRNIVFVIVASLAGGGLHALGVNNALADLVANFNPAWREIIAVSLAPVAGIGVAEFLGSKLIWRLQPNWLRRWLFKQLQGGIPDLSGEWNVVWKSNDSRNLALLQAYRGERQADVPLDKIELGRYAGKLVIDATPVEITVRLKPAKVTEANWATVVRLYREANGDVVLTYQSTPTVPFPSDRDSATYCFAARLCFHPEEGGRFRGSYHTDRGKWLGQNAAGEMELSRS